MSLRKQIVAKILAKLEDNNVTDATHFFTNPFREIDAEELPAIKAGLLAGNAERYNNAIEYKRNEQLVIAYQCEGNDDDVSDKVYKNLEKLENFLINEENTTQFDGLLNDMVYQGWEASLKTAEVGTGGVVLKFDVEYYTKHEPNLDPLTGFEVEIKSSEAAEDDDPLFEESIDLPQT